MTPASRGTTLPQRLPLLLLFLLLGCRLEQAPSGRPPGELPAVDSLANIEQDSALSAGVQSVLRAYYERTSNRDWRAVRGMFWSGTTVAIKWTPPGERMPQVGVQSVEEYVRRIAEGPGRMAIFNERMLHAHVTGYGDVADAWVVKEGRAGRSRDSLRVTRSIDAFHLFRDRGGWRIAGLVSTPELSTRPLASPGRAAPRPAP